MYYLSGLGTETTDSQYLLHFKTIPKEASLIVFVIKAGDEK